MLPTEKLRKDLFGHQVMKATPRDNARREHLGLVTGSDVVFKTGLDLKTIFLRSWS